MVAAPNRPFGALKAPSSSADMTHQKGPPATARGVSWGRCGGTDKRDEPTCPRHPTQRPAPATDRRPGERVGSRSVGRAAGRRSELHRGGGPLAPAAVGGPVAGGGRVRAGAGRGARRDPFPARCGRGPHHARLRHRPAPARAPATAASAPCARGPSGPRSSTTACRSTSRRSRRLGRPSTPAVPSSGRSSRTSSGSSSSARPRPPPSRRPTASWPSWLGLGHGRERRCAASWSPPGRRSATPRRSTRRRSPSLEALQIEATGLQVRREELGPAPVPAGVADADQAAIEDVRDALAAIQSVMIDGEVDRTAEALAAAWSDLHADLEQLGQHDGGPTAAELDARPAARRRGGRGPRRRSTPRRPPVRSPLTSAPSSTPPTPRSSKPRSTSAAAGGGGAARRQLEQAQAAERELLDRARLRWLPRRRPLRGPLRGQQPSPSRRGTRALRRQARPRRARAAPVATPPRSTTSSPSAPGCSTRSPTSSASIPAMPSSRSSGPIGRSPRRCGHRWSTPWPRSGVHPVGMSLDDAASNFLLAHPLPDPDDADDDDADVRAEEHRVELAAIEARWTALQDELRAAESEVDRSAEALQMARALRRRLRERADRPGRRGRAAAPALRGGRAAASPDRGRRPASLQRAEDDARTAIETAGQVVATAEADFDQAAGVVSDLARRTRKLAEELPIDQRPEGDPARDAAGAGRTRSAGTPRSCGPRSTGPRRPSRRRP